MPKSPQYKCNIYANTAPAGLADPLSVRRWIDKPSVVCPSSPLPVGIEMIQWQSCGHFYWMELTEHTFPNLLAGIDKAMVLGVGFGLLIGATRQGTPLLLDNPEEPLPLPQMI